MRLFTLASALLAIALLGFGCASTSHYGTGIRATGAPKFFFHMEQAARTQGYRATRSDDNSQLRVSTDIGYLNYYIQDRNDEIMVQVTVYNPDDLNQNFIRQQENKLLEIDDGLQAEARARAEDANVFER